MVGKNLLEHPDANQYEILTPTSIELDLRDYNATKTYLELHNPDFVIHAAGKVGGIQANIREPVKFLVENLDLNRNLILAAKESNIKHLLNLGSSCMYPRNRPEALTEDMILSGELEPTNEGYALAKIISARLCEYITKENDSFKYKTLIPCNLYGKYDKFDPLNSHLIPAIIDKIHKAKIKSSSVEIWGNGSARREFMYASDLADAIFTAVTDFDSLPLYMNIGLGYDFTINEYYTTVAKIIGFKGKFKHNLDKPVGMSRKLVNIELQSKWGWSAKYSLEEGIKETYQYYLKDYKQ